MREWSGFESIDEWNGVDGVGGLIDDAISLTSADYHAHDPTDPDGTKTYRMRSRFALRFGDQKSESDASVIRSSAVRTAFNSPFWPFVLASTSIGQEGLDFHLYCHAIVHWNLPSNPVDLEQREGRVHRYKGHAIRKNVAARHGGLAWDGAGDPWARMFESASDGRTDGETDLVPFWTYPGPAKIERYVPSFPFSRETSRLHSLKASVARYRLVFGQPRQADLLEFLADLDDEELLAELRIDLSPNGARPT